MSEQTKNCVYFITPVHERYEITSICLRQKVDACVQLEAAGINAQCVVIGDDDNMELAADLGFATVIRNNDYLGAKWNDGHEYAAKHGATHTAPVGSDSFLDPKWLINSLPSTRSVLVSKYYAMVHKTGLKRAHFEIPYVSYVVPVKLMEHCDYRPVYEQRAKGCDTNTFQTLYDSPPSGPVRHLYPKQSHQLDTVAFQSATQITDYDRLYGKWGISETYDAFGGLKEHYPHELVDELEQLFNINNELVSYDLLERALPYVRKVSSANNVQLVQEMEACLIKRERDHGTTELDS